MGQVGFFCEIMSQNMNTHYSYQCFTLIKWTFTFQGHVKLIKFKIVQRGNSKAGLGTKELKYKHKGTFYSIKTITDLLSKFLHVRNGHTNSVTEVPVYTLCILIPAKRHSHSAVLPAAGNQTYRVR